MASPLTATEIDIPQHSGDVLCLPPAAEFIAAARSNADALGSSEIRIGGLPLASLRQRTRRAALAAAAAFCRNHDIPVDLTTDHRDLVIGTGHQPFLFHPGIWAKQLLVDRLTSEATVLNMPVDCDAAEDVGADAPHLNGGLRIVRETLAAVDPDVPYEAIDAPSPARWQAFLDRLDGHLQTLPHRGVHEVFSTFRRAAANLRAADIGTFLTLARRRYEARSRYGELPVSHLAALPEFRVFFLHILADADRFAAVYNTHLNTYRERYNVRTAAQPFPNLGRDGARIEMPFWVVREGRRRPLYVERDGAMFRLHAGEDQVGSVRTGDPEEIAGLQLRPKALALTAFTRLCLVDLFVHGVGGARYDRVTDAVIAEFFGISPPRYAAVSATLHLPLREFDPSEERAALQRRLLELLHNPERMVSAPTEGQRQVIDEKWQLIRALGAKEMTRRARREATQRIREINEHLSGGFGSQREEIEHRLAALAEISHASVAATHRGYPFCFFPVEAVEELTEVMVRNAFRRNG